jgi:hypothetical protein
MGDNHDLLANSHNTVNICKNYFSRLLNMYVIDVRPIEIYTVVPLIPGSSHLEVETATAKLKKYKSASSDQIPTELIRT